MRYRDSIAFLGGGNMAEALVGGILRAGLASPARITVSEPREERRATLKKTFGVAVTADNRDAAGGAGTLFLAVKPQVLPQVLDEAAGDVGKDCLVVSIAAGIPLSYLEARLPGVPVVRAMPNTPALVGAGATVLAPGRLAGEDMVQWAREVFSCVGLCLILPEERMDAVTGLSGSGPAYVFAMAEALIEAGRAAGLTEEAAAALTVQTILGAARMMAETGREPADLRAAVTSPGGTTQAGLEVLTAGGFSDLIIRTVKRAAERSSELGKK